MQNYVQKVNYEVYTKFCEKIYVKRIATKKVIKTHAFSSLILTLKSEEKNDILLMKYKKGGII